MKGFITNGEKNCVSENGRMPGNCGGDIRLWIQQGNGISKADHGYRRAQRVIRRLAGEMEYTYAPLCPGMRFCFPKMQSELQDLVGTSGKRIGDAVKKSCDNLGEVFAKVILNVCSLAGRKGYVCMSLVYSLATWIRSRKCRFSCSMQNFWKKKRRSFKRNSGKTEALQSAGCYSRAFPDNFDSVNRSET